MPALGVIENDFHPRTNLFPNVCAVCVKPAYRGRGIAGRLLAYVAADMKRRGFATLDLLTDHTGFYERYGWEYLCPVVADGEKKPSRMYVHKAQVRKAQHKPPDVGGFFLAWAQAWGENPRFSALFERNCSFCLQDARG